MAFASASNPGKFMDRLRSARRRIILAIAFMTTIRILVGIVQAAEASQKARTDQALLLGRTAWIVILCLTSAMSVLVMGLWYYLVPPFVKFMSWFNATTKLVPPMEIVVSVDWMRTAAWYVLFVNVVQSVFMGVAYVTMHVFTHVSIGVILAGDVAMTIASCIGLSVIAFVAYHETDYKATELRRKE